MSRKGCSPDNARAEGFFGRLKIEFFYGRDWNGVALDEFADMLDAYLRWYRDVRLKSDLGYRSPMQYRRDLGLIARSQTVQDFHRSPFLKPSACEKQSTRGSGPGARPAGAETARPKS